MTAPPPTTHKPPFMARPKARSRDTRRGPVLDRVLFGSLIAWGSFGAFLLALLHFASPYSRWSWGEALLFLLVWTGAPVLLALLGGGAYPEPQQQHDDSGGGE